jgi:transposase
VPHVTYGHSKDRRPDLKQVMYSLIATSGGMVPLLGRVSSGNRSDAPELRFTIRQLVDVLPAPSASILIADCKAFCASTLALFERHGLQYLTLMPRGLKLWDQAYAAGAALAAQGPLPTLKVKRAEGAEAHWRGASFQLVYEQELDEQELAELQRCGAGEEHAAGGERRPVGSRRHVFQVRTLVVRSDALREQKRPMLERHQQAEASKLRKLQEKLRKRLFSCRADAEEEVERIAAQGARFHRIAVAAVQKERPAKRAKAGRPRQGEVAPTECGWEVELGLAEDPAAFARELDQEGTFVLASNVASTGPQAKSDAELLDLYDDQFKVEAAFHWAKTPLVVAPVFLKTPHRIAALGVVYVVALMAYALIQRHIRARLAAERTYLSGNIGTTTKPTTEVLYRLFRGISTVRTSDDPASPVTVANLNVEQLRVLDLLGCSSHRRPGVVIAPPRAPRRGERAYRAYARRMAELAADDRGDDAEDR